MTNLLYGIWDCDNSIKKNRIDNKAKGLISKCQIMNLEGKKNNKGPLKKTKHNWPHVKRKGKSIERQSWKNNKVKSPTVKQF